MASEQVVQRAGRRYREMLRPIGAHLDLLQARNLTLAELDDGFMWHYLVEEHAAPPSSATLTYEELSSLGDQVRHAKEAWRAKAARLQGDHEPEPLAQPRYSTGYEDLLRSLGARLEAQQAEKVLIVECGHDLLVRYALMPPAFVRREAVEIGELVSFREDLYSAEQLAELIATMRSRRGSKFFY